MDHVPTKLTCHVSATESGYYKLIFGNFAADVLQVWFLGSTVIRSLRWLALSATREKREITIGKGLHVPGAPLAVTSAVGAGRPSRNLERPPALPEENS